MKYILSLLLVFVAFTAFSQIPKPLKDTYVNDFAKVLSKSEIKKLNDTINQIEKKSGVQLALVIVNKIPKEYDLEEYSLLIARRWKVGNKEDGLVYVAAVQQRKQRLEVARNLEAIFTTQASQDALTKTKAHFRVKNYGKGLAALVADISFKLDSAGYGEAPEVQSLAAVDKQTNNKTASNKESDSGFGLLGFLGVAFFLCVILIIMRVFRSRQNGPPLVGGQQFGNYNNGYNNGYGGGYNGGNRSGLGSFFAGAATGYIANNFLNRNRSNNNQTQFHQEQEENHSSSSSSSGFGNWGSSRDDSSDSDNSSSGSRSSGGSSSSGSGSSSSSGGFSGGGASSDW